MTAYRVTWTTTVEIERATSPEDAARRALAHQQHSDAIPAAFRVMEYMFGADSHSPEVTVDLNAPAARLEYLRGQIHAESIAIGEIAELQGLADYIQPGDTELLEWAGVPESAVRTPHGWEIQCTECGQTYIGDTATEDHDPCPGE